MLIIFLLIFSPVQMVLVVICWYCWMMLLLHSETMSHSTLQTSVSSVSVSTAVHVAISCDLLQYSRCRKCFRGPNEWWASLLRTTSSLCRQNCLLTRVTQVRALTILKSRAQATQTSSSCVFLSFLSSFHSLLLLQQSISTATWGRVS